MQNALSKITDFSKERGAGIQKVSVRAESVRWAEACPSSAWQRRAINRVTLWFLGKMIGWRVSKGKSACCNRPPTRSRPLLSINGQASSRRDVDFNVRPSFTSRISSSKQTCCATSIAVRRPNWISATESGSHDLVSGFCGWVGCFWGRQRLTKRRIQPIVRQRERIEEEHSMSCWIGLNSMITHPIDRTPGLEVSSSSGTLPGKEGHVSALWRR